MVVMVRSRFVEEIHLGSDLLIRCVGALPGDSISRSPFLPSTKDREHRTHLVCECVRYTRVVELFAVRLVERATTTITTTTTAKTPTTTTKKPCLVALMQTGGTGRIVEMFV